VHRSQCGDEALKEGELVTGVVEEDPVNPGKWQAKDVWKSGTPAPRSNAAITSSAQKTGDALEGVVSEWSGTYGFIHFIDGRRAYVHNSQCYEGMLYEGQEVVAQITQDPRNPGKLQAFDVKSKVLQEFDSTQQAVERTPNGGRHGANQNARAGALQGVVSEWKPGNSYGFVQFSDGRRAYVHTSQCGDYGSFTEGQCVSCYVVDDVKNAGKFQAVEVEPCMPKVLNLSVSTRESRRETEGTVVDGKVTQWSPNGYGFIECSDGRRAYVHNSAFGGQHLQMNEIVTASLKEDARNPGKWSVDRVIGVGLVATPSVPSDTLPPRASNLVKGTVSEWNPRGFGFVMMEDGRRAYVHSSQCPFGQHLSKGETIFATIVPDPSNPGKFAAHSVTKASDSEELWVEPPAKRNRYLA
jgi:cold shock CspA family protein